MEFDQIFQPFSGIIVGFFWGFYGIEHYKEFISFFDELAD